MITPKSVDLLNDKEIKITWSDNHVSPIVLANIRNSCDCATCRDQKEQGLFKREPYPESGAIPKKYQLMDIEPIGRYAYCFVWGDGHLNGIYAFDVLRELCGCEECLKKNKLA